MTNWKETYQQQARHLTSTGLYDPARDQLGSEVVLPAPRRHRILEVLGGYPTIEDVGEQVP